MQLSEQQFAKQLFYEKILLNLLIEMHRYFELESYSYIRAS